jgi:hypothetical protein
MLEFKMHKLFVLTLTIHLATKVAGGIIALLLLYYDESELSFLCRGIGPTALSSESVIVGHGRLMGLAYSSLLLYHMA